MHVIVDFTIVPLGVGVSLSRYVAEVRPILEQAGLSHSMHANGTNVEGEWDIVFAAIRRCHERIHELGAPRVFTTIKAGTRVDREQRMADKLSSVQSVWDEGAD